MTLAPRPVTAAAGAGAPPAPLTAGERALLAGAERALLDDRRLLDGGELLALAALPDGAVTTLAALAHQVRLAWCGPTVEIEGILSAKTGGCPEDCHFCSQSSRFDTPVKATPLLDRDEVLAAARETAALGASEFCIVLAVRGPDERTLARILELVPVVREETGLNVAVSAGILDEDQARRLAEGGVHRYNHNLETARSFFPEVVTTHRWEERAETCRLVRAHGMELCCGALIGMGESVGQRVELCWSCGRSTPTEVPLNFLIPQPGTPSRRPAGHGRLDGRAVDRPLPPRPARGDPSLRRRPGDHAARAAGHGHDRRGQRPHRGQLPDHARPVGRRRPADARGSPHADRRPDRGDLAGPPLPDAYCTGCGRPGAECPGCARAIDPPHYCPACGRWLAVTVSPTGWTARCRDHGELAPGHAPR